MAISLVQRTIGLIVAIGLFAVFAGCGSTGQTRLPDAAQNPEVVAVLGDDVLTIDEFEQRYARSSGSAEAAREDSLAEYQDFLERYVNFRLKVKAAEEAGVSTSPSVLEEIRTYRANLARPYLLEQEVLEPLVRELYDRQQEMVDVSHILVRVDQFAPPADTFAAYQQISAVRDSILQGADFGEIALRHSQDPSVGREGAPGYMGRLGPFTAGRLVEPFETYAYQTALDDVSPVFRTRFGYHILKVHDKRPAEADIRLSHIMIRPSPTPADSATARELMQDLKRQLDEGADFAELARQHSTDMQSRDRGGDIGMMSYSAQVHESFKEPAFALEEIGDVSDVVETPYGLHLIKLTDRQAPQTFEESYDELKQVITQLPRAKEAENDLARQVLRDRDAQIDTALVVDAFRGVPADSVFAKLAAKQLPEEVLSETVLVLGDSSYTFADMAGATTPAAAQNGPTAEARARNILSEFVMKTAIEYEAARLEDRDEEFRRLMDEFRDGLVLFQFMEDSVWTAAEQDSVELEAYYEAHREQYWWPDRTRIISFQTPSDSLLGVVASRLAEGEKAAEIYASFADDTLNTLRMDTTMVADSTHSIYDRALGLAEGEFTEPLPYRGQHILLINGGVEAARQKTFPEARTQVVSDYQQIVEDRLIRRLRQRYNAHTFPERLVNAYNQDERPPEFTSGG